MFIIYPNPASSEINISFQLSTKETVEYLILQEFDTGKLVYRKDDIISNSIVIDASSFRKSYYVVSCSIDGYVYSSLLMINN